MALLRLDKLSDAPTAHLSQTRVEALQLLLLQTIVQLLGFVVDLLCQVLSPLICKMQKSVWPTNINITKTLSTFNYCFS